MGQLLGSLWSAFNPNRHYKLLILGLNNAGKTSILYHLQLGHSIATQPTLGGNVEQLSISHGANSNKIDVSCWDLGGQEQLRDSWRLYYEHTDAVIFVVDAADPARFPAAREVLHKILSSEPQLRQALLLVLANKQDVEGAVGPADLVEALGLGGVNDRTWTLMGCSASKGDSLRNAMSWIAQRVGDRRPASSILEVMKRKAPLDADEKAIKGTNIVIKNVSIRDRYGTDPQALLHAIEEDDNVETNWWRNALRPEANLIEPSVAYLQGIKVLRPATRFNTFDVQKARLRRLKNQKLERRRCLERRKRDIAPTAAMKASSNPYRVPRAGGYIKQRDDRMVERAERNRKATTKDTKRGDGMVKRYDRSGKKRAQKIGKGL